MYLHLSDVLKSESHRQGREDDSNVTFCSITNKQLVPQRPSDQQPFECDGVNVCFWVCVFMSLQEKVGRMGSFSSTHTVYSPSNPEAAESRLSPRWGIHKVQQMKTKCFQLPLAAGNGPDLYWGTFDRVFSWPCSSCPLRAAETFFLQCHSSSAAQISIQANLIP